MRSITLLILGIVFLILSSAGRHWVLSRRIYRGDAADDAGFTDYKDSVAGQSVENFVFRASRVSLFLGVASLLFAYMMIRR
jgi:hypothetical protein